MRIDEIASAEEQLALWKLVSDNVWQAIAAQAEQERRANAENAARSKKRGKRSGKRAASPKPLATKVAPTPPKPAQPTASTASKPIAGSQAQQQQVQPKVAYGANGVQPRVPIPPIPPVAGSVATQPLQQALPKQPKPKITARAGGLTA